MKREGKRRLFAATACAAALALAAVTGTLAYLTDTDSDVNVMTLGNVDIVQVEQERDANGGLVDFKQGKPAYPAVGPVEWDDEMLAINGTKYQVFIDDLKNVVDKIVTVNNTGKSDAYVRTIVAVEAPEGDPKGLIYLSVNTNDTTEGAAFLVDINGVDYYVMEFVYKEALEAGGKSAPSLMQAFLSPAATNEDYAAFGDEWEIKVLSQAVQVDGFEDAAAGNFENAANALNTAFGSVNSDNAKKWFGGMEAPTAVATADELTSALAAGESVYLTDDIEDFNGNASIVIPSGKEATLNLNGHKLVATADKSGNQEMFLVKGTLNVESGSIGMTAQNNQGWDAMAAIFDVTAGGVLNLEGVTASVGGTDMNFIVHLNNWGSATLNVDDCDFTATYVAVRAFNSGYDMNNVTIRNTDFHVGRVFWVHNYTAEGKDDSTLNLDIYGNGNTTDNAEPVRFGFSNSVYYDLDGKAI